LHRQREAAVKRRGFIKEGLKWAASLLGGALLAYPALSFMTFRKTTKRKVLFQPDDQTGSVIFKEGVFLVRKSTEVFAMSAECTHLGCTLKHDPISGRLVCPCHGSVFAISGKRISGPARDDLHRIPLKETGDGNIEALVETG
jgi:cytochrome b6-f complex iron-sulfur subunit